MAARSVISRDPHNTFITTSFESMSHHNHDQHGHHHAPARKPIHKNWKAWAIILLMIVCMLIYIFSLDESRP